VIIQISGLFLIIGMSPVGVAQNGREPELPETSCPAVRDA